MKKLLTIISAVTLTATGAMTLVSCNNEKEVEDKTPPIEMTFEQLLASKISDIYDGTITEINASEETNPYDINSHYINDLIWIAWNEDTSKFFDGFMVGVMKIQNDMKMDFKLKAKPGHSDKTDIILHSWIDEEGTIHSK